jgi:hypothetical protein
MWQSAYADPLTLVQLETIISTTIKECEAENC